MWHRDRGANRAAGLLGGAVVAVALLTLGEYAGGVDLGIDQLLSAIRARIQGQAPGRMAFNSTVAFVCLGSALVLMSSRRRAARDLIAVLGWATGTVGLLALVGYAAQLSVLTGVRPYVSVALHTGSGSASRSRSPRRRRCGA